MHTVPDAVVTMECQRGVIGDLATFPALASAVREVELIASVERLVVAARLCGVTVAHATVEFRPDRRGSPTNAPLLRHAARIPGQLLTGSDAAELIPELGPEPSDFVSCRHHGVSPFTGTSLDSLLRSERIDTIIACGVSLNVGILGLCIEAVNLGYEVLLPLDATVAVPTSYAPHILENTLGVLATLCTIDEVVDRWADSAGEHAHSPKRRLSQSAACESISVERS